MNLPYIGIDPLIRHQFRVSRFKFHGSSLWIPEYGFFDLGPLTQASSSTVDNQSAKLVYNLVYRKDRGSRLERKGYWGRLSVRFGYRLRGGADIGCRCCGHELLLDADTNTKFKNIFLIRYSLHLSSYF